MRVKAILLSMIMLSMPCVAYGSEPEVTVYQESWDQIISSIEDNEHGGIYIDNGVLHIKPIEDMPIASVFSVDDTTENTIQIDPVAKYSMEELKAAKKLISENREALDVNSIATSNRYNSIIVTSSCWNDNKKEAVKSIAGIDNIIYEIRENGNDVDYVPTPSADQENTTPYSLIPYRIGEEMVNYDTDFRQTIGGCVTLGSSSGFITTAHGNNIGDKMVGIGTDSFGTVNKLKMGGSVDAVFVKKGPNDNIDLTDKVRLSSNPSNLGTISSAGAPPAEGAVVRFGNSSGYSIAVILANDWEGDWDGQIDSNNYYTNMLHLDIGSSEGDSGGPCMSYLTSDGTYKLVALTKGTLENGEGIATRWDSIQDEFGVSIY